MICADYYLQDLLSKKPRFT